MPLKFYSLRTLYEFESGNLITLKKISGNDKFSKLSIILLATVSEGVSYNKFNTQFNTVSSLHINCVNYSIL